MGKRSEQPLSIEDIHTGGDKHRKRCTISCIIRELQIKTRRHTCTPILELLKPNTTPNAGLDVEQQEVVLLLVGTQNRTATCEDRWLVSLLLLFLLLT